jgi:CSLREA domain-containing protein
MRGTPVPSSLLRRAPLALAATLALGVAALATPAAFAATITVDSTSDAAVADGLCTLREAVRNANQNSQVPGAIAGDCPAGQPAPTVDEIRFNIGGGGPQTIAVGAPGFEQITDPVTIDATTQPGPGALPRITLDGPNQVEVGFLVRASGSTVRGFAIVDWSVGILIAFNVSDVAIEGNHIGVDRTGLVAIPNTRGVQIQSATNVRVGGSTAAQRNVISGNDEAGISIPTIASNVVVQGNYIGTTASGNADLGNGGPGIDVEDNQTQNTRIGGAAPGEGNVISGNGASGIFVHDQAIGTIVQGNRIGTNAAGTAAIPNGDQGIRLDGAVNTTIGGTAAGAGNLISGNGREGVFILGGASNTTIQGNRIGTDAAGAAAIGNGTGGMRVETSTSTQVGGTAAGARNQISGNGGVGIAVFVGAAGAIVEGNYIGTDGTGAAAVPNAIGGVVLSSDGADDRIGGTAAGAGNLISGNNAYGIRLDSGSGFTIQGNSIGTDAAGASPLPNDGPGIQFFASSTNTIGGVAAGAGNTISFNAESGLFVGIVSSNNSIIGNAIASNGQAGIFVINGSTGNLIQGNRVRSNGGLGIDLDPVGVTPNDPGDADAGANRRQNVPVVATATTGGTTAVAGTLNSTPNTNGFRIEVFRNAACDPSGNGEGEAFLGATTANTDANGNAAWNLAGLPAVPVGTFITATATAPTNDTSEFSACRAVVQAASGGITVAPTNVQTTEAGGQAQFTVVLTAAPSADVTIGLSTSDATEGTVSPASLTFTPGNALVPQVVTVTGVDDTLADGNVAYTIVTAPAVSADPVFNGVNPADVAAVNLDNEAASGVTIGSANVVEGTGGASSVTLDVTLNPPPGSVREIRFATADGTATAGADYAATGGTLTFQPGEATKQITVQLVPDALAEPDETLRVVLTDPNTNATLAEATVVILNDDGDPAATPAPPPPDEGKQGEDDSDKRDTAAGNRGNNESLRSQSGRATEEQREQSRRTNRGGLDDYRTEGNVVAVDRDARPPTATIATRDGLQVVVLLCRDGCDEPRVGDYLEAEGVKEHEGLFYADSVTSRRPR